MSAKDFFKEFTDFTEKELQQADGEVNVLTLFVGRTAIGDDFWAYMLVPPSKYISLYEAVDFADNPLTNFGTIIEWGMGDAPPPEIKDFIEVKYQANHNLEAEVLAKAKEIETRMRISGKLIRKILDEE